MVSFSFFSCVRWGFRCYTPPTCTFSQPGWDRYLILRIITRCLGVRCGKGIKMVCTCVPGSNLNIIGRLNWIPSGVFIGIKLCHLILSPVDRLATTSNDSRGWQLCGEKSTLLFNQDIGSLLKWLNRFKTRSSLDPARVLIIGINPSACFVMWQLRYVLIISVKIPPRLRRISKTR